MSPRLYGDTSLFNVARCDGLYASLATNTLWNKYLKGNLLHSSYFYFLVLAFFPHDTNASTQLHGRSNCLCCVAPYSCHTENTRVFLRHGTKNIQALRACVRARARATTVRKITAAVNGRLGRTECGPRSGSNPKRVSKAPPHSHRPSPTTAPVMSP